MCSSYMSLLNGGWGARFINWRPQSTDPVNWFSEFLLEIFLMILLTSRELALLTDCKLSPLHKKLLTSLASNSAQRKGAQKPCSLLYLVKKLKFNKITSFSIANLSLRLILQSRNACNLMAVHLQYHPNVSYHPRAKR